jgi:hypothetical protein
MAKTNAQKQSRDEQQFPSCILYSSPPEASSLSDWVREVQSNRSGSGLTPQNQPRVPDLMEPGHRDKTQ